MNLRFRITAAALTLWAGMTVPAFAEDPGAAARLVGAAGQAAAGAIARDTGRACTIRWFGWQNCCTDSGFLIDTGLAQCTENERELAEEHAAGTTRYLGEYCARGALAPGSLAHGAAGSAAASGSEGHGGLQVVAVGHGQATASPALASLAPSPAGLCLAAAPQPDCAAATTDGWFTPCGRARS